MGFFGGSKIIGLDIGSSSMKMAELSVSRGQFSLVSFGMMPTPLNAIEHGQLKDATLIAQGIEQLRSQIKSTTKSISTGMWGASVIVKKVTMAKVDRKIEKEQIKFEAEQYIPFPIDTVALTYEKLKSGSGGETMDILLVAAQNELLMHYIEAVRLAHLDCKIIDVNAFALANCFEINYGVHPAESIGLINLGAEVTNFVVINDGEVLFSRDIGVGGLSFTHEIQKAIGSTVGEAEAFKIAAVEGREVPDEVHAVISSETDRFAEEIKNSYDFFAASSGDLKVSRFFFSGGASNMQGLVDTLSRSLGAPFERLDPFKRIKVNSKKFSLKYIEQASLFAPIVLGLAAR